MKAKSPPLIATNPGGAVHVLLGERKACLDRIAVELGTRPTALARQLILDGLDKHDSKRKQA